MFVIWSIISNPKVEVSKGQLNDLTEEEKLEDFNYLYNTLKDSFPYFEIEEEKTGFNWLNRKEEFEEKIKNTKNNKEFYMELNNIINLVQNGHTNIISPNSFNDFAQTYKGLNNRAWNKVLSNESVINKYHDWSQIIDENRYVLPINVRYIEGHYVVTKDYKNIKNGDIINKVNGISIDNFIYSLIDKTYLYYDFIRSKLYMGNSLISVEPNSEYKLELINTNGEVYNCNMTSIVYEKDIKRNNNNSFKSEILEENKIAYLKVNSMNSNTLKDDKSKIYDFFQNIKDYPYLIIDIRGNGGGSDNYWIENIVQPLIGEKIKCTNAVLFKGKYIYPFLKSRGIMTKNIDSLPKEYSNEYIRKMDSYRLNTIKVSPINSINYNGRILLLVDSHVYSSAETFASFCKSTSFAKVIGTETGGDGIGIDPCIVALPNSWLVVRFSLDMGINCDGTINEKEHTKPDILVEQTYYDYINNVDTILNKALEYSK